MRQCCPLEPTRGVIGLPLRSVSGVCAEKTYMGKLPGREEGAEVDCSIGLGPSDLSLTHFSIIGRCGHTCTVASLRAISTFTVWLGHWGLEALPLGHLEPYSGKMYRLRPLAPLALGPYS